MDKILDKLKKIESRMTALESKIYGDKPSDMIACSFDVISERRWTDKKDNLISEPLCPVKDKQYEYVAFPDKPKDGANKKSWKGSMERNEMEKLIDGGWEINELLFEDIKNVEKSKNDGVGFFTKCEKQEYADCPEDMFLDKQEGPEFNVCGPPELVKSYLSKDKKGYSIVCNRDIEYVLDSHGKRVRL